MIRVLFSTLLFLTLNTIAQDTSSFGGTLSTYEKKDRVYKLNPATDIPVFAITAGWTGYALTKIYNKDSSTLAQILSLKKEDINGFDRGGADIYSLKAKRASDIFFYGSMPLPLFLFIDKDIRKDAAKIFFLYLETMSVTGFIYTGAVYLVDRYRPFAYNPNVPIEERKRGGGKNSFFAGHVAVVGSSTFFMAKVFSDYHPDSKFKYFLYGAAIVATGTTGYLRHKGGQHFPSDILLGIAVGTASGILVPHSHKNKAYKNSNISFTPFTGSGPGFGLVYTFK